MNCEHSPERPTAEGSVPDPHELAEAEFDRRVEQLQEAGEMLRPSQLETQEALDEHFDELSRLYRQVYWEMGLAWPPPPRSLDDDVEIADWPEEWGDLTLGSTLLVYTPLCQSETSNLYQPDPTR